MRYMEPVEVLARWSFASYMARLYAEKRLRKTGQMWNAAQFSLSTALISVSIVFLVFPQRQSPVVAVLLVILSVLALVVSIVVTFLDYSARARAMFFNYRALQTFSVKAETIVQVQKRISKQHLRGLQREYNSIMDGSENHSSLDHKIAQARESRDSLPINLIAGACKLVLLQILLILLSFAAVAVAIASIT